MQATRLQKAYEKLFQVRKYLAPICLTPWAGAGR
jgi:hypothetical protein